MAFILPTFPLECDVWHAYDPAVSFYAAPDVIKVKCNLSPGRRVMTGYAHLVPVNDYFVFPMEVLFQPGEDIRSFNNAVIPDLIELPFGTGRFYIISYVDDIAKGFANEHRFCICHLHAVDTVFVDVTVPFPIPIP
jgi:hypothetical protein